MKTHEWNKLTKFGWLIFLLPSAGLLPADGNGDVWAGNSAVYRLDWHEGYLGRTRELLAPGRPLGRFLDAPDSDAVPSQATIPAPVSKGKDLPEGGASTSAMPPPAEGPVSSNDLFDERGFYGCLKDAIPLLKLEFQILTASDGNAAANPDQNVLVDIIEAELNEQRSARSDGRVGFPCSKKLGSLAIASRNVLEDLKIALAFDAVSNLRKDDRKKLWIAFIAARDSRYSIEIQSIWNGVLRDFSLRLAFEGAATIPQLAEVKDRIAQGRGSIQSANLIRDRADIKDTAWRDAYELGLRQATLEIEKLKFERDGS